MMPADARVRIMGIRDELRRAMRAVSVPDLDPDDERGDLVTAVKRLQKRVREGKVI